jgi:hypothetical protein
MPNSPLSDNVSHTIDQDFVDDLNPIELRHHRWGDGRDGRREHVPLLIFQHQFGESVPEIDPNDLAAGLRVSIVLLRHSPPCLFSLCHACPPSLCEIN